MATALVVCIREAFNKSTHGRSWNHMHPQLNGLYTQVLSQTCIWKQDCALWTMSLEFLYLKREVFLLMRTQPVNCKLKDVTTFFRWWSGSSRSFHDLLSHLQEVHSVDHSLSTVPGVAVSCWKVWPMQRKTKQDMGRGEELSNCTCQKVRVTVKHTSAEALSSTEKDTRANMRNCLSSISPGDGSIDCLGLVACITFQPTLLKVPSNTWWLARTFHNPWPAAYPADKGSSNFAKCYF